MCVCTRRSLFLERPNLVCVSLVKSIHVVCSVGHLGSEYDRRMVIACVSAFLQCFVCYEQIGSISP
jgi:hypothetical protein